jgi:hypothetical protein
MASKCLKETPSLHQNSKTYFRRWWLTTPKTDLPWSKSLNTPGTQPLQLHKTMPSPTSEQPNKASKQLKSLPNKNKKRKAK